MNSHSTVAAEQVQTSSSNGQTSEGQGSSRRPTPKKGLGPLKPVLVILILAVAFGVAYATLGKERMMEGFAFLKEQVVGAPRSGKAETDTTPLKPKPNFNGMVQVEPKEREAIGFRIIPVVAQSEPIKLELNGTTDYDQNTLVRIRPRFDNALVEKVYVSAGQSVKKGDSLLELRSAELAASKNESRTKFVQWDHDHKLLISREPLAKEGRLTQIIWTDTVNDEKKSRLEYLQAREKLATYKMTNEQIDKLNEGLSDDRKTAIQEMNNSEDIGRMTVVSEIDGVVVERDVVPGNFYDMKDIMMTISPMTELWIWGNVFESDQDKVHIGQKWDIVFQFSHETFEGKVESIANGVDPETRTLRIRASIPNPGQNLKARMLVRAILQIPPLPGETSIPRNALSVVNGEYYAFVQKGQSGNDANLFERRKLEIEQENSGFVVVKKGLKPDERIVSNGSLILAQLYEDQSIVDSGLPQQ